MIWIKRLFLAIFFSVITVFLVSFVAFDYFRRTIIHFTANIDDYTFFENNTVQVGEHRPWPKNKNYNTVQLTADMEEYLKKFQTVAFVVMKDSSILFERYREGYGDSSLSGSFSMAKSVVALLIGAAIKDGYIRSVDEPVGNYIPEFTHPDKQNITIRHVLQMSSGLSWYESYWNPYSITAKAYYGSELDPLILERQKEEEPGIIWRYKSGDTQILAMILKNAVGKSLSEYVAEKFWKPMGAKHSALWSVNKQGGIEKAYCCFNSNALDFARFGQLLLQNGVWAGDTLLDVKFLREAISPAINLQNASGGEVKHYGYQIWIKDYKGERIPYFRGILGQYIFVIPSRNAVIVRLGHKRDKGIDVSNPNDIDKYLQIGEYIISQTDK